MKTNPSVVSLATAVLIASLALPCTGADELTALRLKYEEQLAGIEARSSARMAQIGEQYAGDLKALAARMKARGDLDGVLSIRREANRFAQAKDLTSTSIVEQPKTLHAIQTSYLNTFAAAVPIEKSRSISLLWHRYDGALTALEKRLTSHDDIEGALVVRKERERVRDSAAVRSAEFVLADSEARQKAGATIQQPEDTQATATPLRIEGFAKSVSASNARAYNTYRGIPTMSYWAYARDGQQFAWKTAKVPRIVRSDRVVIEWAGANGTIPAEFELVLNGKPLLTFSSGQATSREWTSGASSLAFVFHSYTPRVGNVGTYALTVPVRLLIAGREQTLRVIPKEKDQPGTWVMIHNFTDMTARESEGKRAPDESSN